MATDRDLFEEEQGMLAMSFGDHLEDLRRHLILALIGLFVGVTITFVPGLSLGSRVFRQMQDPAQAALERYYNDQSKQRAEEAKASKAKTEDVVAFVQARDFAEAVRRLYPQLPAPAEADLRDAPPLAISMNFDQAGMIAIDNQVTRKPDTGLISLAPMETFAMYFMVCLVTGLVVASPWVFYQLWAFVAAGLYRHERAYVYRLLPFSLGLFLAGVALCFFVALPWTLEFLLNFNVWLGIAPTLRISDWMGFATILPLIFGISFQTPLVMLFLERIGIFTADDYRSKWRLAFFIIIVAAAIITPTQDPFSLALLAVPMMALYGLGIFLVSRKRVNEEAAVAA
ncbi:MAG: twin-arginine translocase subunit TatC [Isosphaeraceae bacterium]